MEQASHAFLSILFIFIGEEAVSSVRSRLALQAVTLLGMDHSSLKKPAGQ
jgi:hypothetical protein